MKSCLSPSDLESWWPSAQKHFYVSRTSADSAQCLLPKGIHLDVSFHCSPTTTEILRASWCQRPGCSGLYFTPNLHTHPSFVPSLHHYLQWYDWNQMKYIWSTQLGLPTYAQFSSGLGKKGGWFVQIWTFHPCPWEAKWRISFSHKPPKQIVPHDANGFIPELNFKRENCSPRPSLP